MSITFYGLIFALIGLWCFMGSPFRAVVVMMALTPFASISALELSSLGGASILPANFFLLFFMARLLTMRTGLNALLSQVTPRRALCVFAILTLWVVASSILLPRLFDGQTHVFSLSRFESGDGIPVPLHPSSGNISQAVYGIGDLMIACVTSAFVGRAGGFRAALLGLTIATSFHILFGFLDLVTSATGTSSLLDIVHTANYALLTSDTSAGLKRLSGTFTEASSFATYSLMLLGVNFALFVIGFRPVLTGLASFTLTLFIILTTSSAGYAGLAIFYAGFLVYSLIGALFGKRRPVMIAMAVAAAAILTAVVVMLFLPSVGTFAVNLINDSILNKSTSDSAIERGSWNAQALQVFWDTGGTGAGVGSTRASNYVLLLMSNLGFLGTGLFALLILWLVLGPVNKSLDRQDRAMTFAARTGIITALLPALFVGTIYDLGALFYCLMGIAAAGTSGLKPLARDRPRMALMHMQERRSLI